MFRRTALVALVIESHRDPHLPGVTFGHGPWMAQRDPGSVKKRAATKKSQAIITP